MRAVVVNAFGPPEDLRVEERPIPEPGPGEVVAKVAAAGVNFADVLMVAGRYQVKPELPFTPGLEFSGTIAAIGDGVTAWRVGDRVMGAPTAGGAFAEYIALSGDHIFRAPDSLSFDLAAQLVLAHGTAAFAFQRAGLRAGESVLITGAGGGVGTAGVAVAKRLGARVIAAASSAEKLSAAKSHGADVTIDYRSGDLRAEVRAATGGEGVDVVLELVGGEVFDAALRSTARWARVTTVGFASGTIPRIPAEYLLLKNLSAIGVGFGGALIENPALAHRVVDDLIALHEAQPFEAEVGGRFALAETGVALRQLADRQVVGKLIIEPN
jgi:NADPH2:quinone reductase